MGFFRRLFGSGKKTEPDEQTTTQPSTRPDQETEYIRLRDAEGYEVAVHRQDWFDQFLAGRIKESWDHPEQLASVIGQAMRENFFHESIGPAERLMALEDSPRSCNLLTDAYLGASRVADAERTVRTCISKYGRSGANLTNLAHVQTLRGKYGDAEDTLLRALQLDPNYERAICWYESSHREKHGDAAGIAAISRIARLSGAWRPQLWLGQHAMSSDQPERAREMFRDCLAKISRPAPMSVLADISACLGSSGYFREIEELVEPAFDAKLHTIHVGSNLMRAHTEMGQFDKARKILDQLHAVQRPQDKDQLDYWTKALAQAEVS